MPSAIPESMETVTSEFEKLDVDIFHVVENYELFEEQT
jgi:hypothetical protein